MAAVAPLSVTPLQDERQPLLGMVANSTDLATGIAGYA